MTKQETLFDLVDDLIVVKVHLMGPLGPTAGRFVFDTGAVATTMVPELAHRIGYSARDAFKITKVHTAIGAEDGYVLHVAEFGALGHVMRPFAINVFDLGHDIDGLLGMNFLSDFNVEIRPSERRLFAEKLSP